MGCDEQSSHGTALSEVHPDILRRHILSRLDGPALAAVSCASSELRGLCADDALWRGACTAAWPSVAFLPISSHRALFADAFPGLDDDPHHLCWGSTEDTRCSLISAVDMLYDGKPIFSRAKQMDMAAPDWPFHVDLLEPKESVATPIPRDPDDEGSWALLLQQRLRLSWLVVDSAGRRAANVSSGVAVRAERHWLTGQLHLRFSTVMPGGRVLCSLAVTCGGDGLITHVSHVSMHLEDLQGRHLCGRHSLALLSNALRAPRHPRLRVDPAHSFEEFSRSRLKVASTTVVAALGNGSLHRSTTFSSGFLKPSVALRNPLITTKVRASSAKFTCFERDWLRRDFNVIGFGLIGWLAPSSIPAINGKSLTGLFFESIGAELAHFPTPPPLTSQFWLWLVTWHIGLFLCLTFGQIGFKGRTEDYF